MRPGKASITPVAGAPQSQVTSFKKQTEPYVNLEQPQATVNVEHPAPNKKQRMFSNPFSFEGRIRRTEYGISLILYIVPAFILNIYLDKTEDPGSELLIALLVYIFIQWFLWTQGAKRCHDLGNSGWFQIIPFYFLWMIFAVGEPGINVFGRNPKK